MVRQLVFIKKNLNFSHHQEFNNLLKRRKTRFELIVKYKMTTTKSKQESNKMMIFSNKALFDVIVASAIFVSFVLALSVVQANNCHLRELDLCAATLVVFMQSPSGLAISDNELNKQCGYLKEADSCLRNYTSRCMTPLQRQIVTFLGDGSMQMLDEYCRPGTELRKSYLKHATCLNSVQKNHQKACIKDLQTAFETLTAPSTSTNESGLLKRAPVACCTFKRFEHCINSQVEKKCGKEALHFISLVLKRALSRMPEMVCKNYKNDGTECKSLLPPPGTLPKGSKSSSVISRLFSAYTGV